MFGMRIGGKWLIAGDLREDYITSVSAILLFI